MVCEDGKYYSVMKAVAGEMHYDREIFYQYGKLLLEAGHPVLKDYLEQRRSVCETIQRKLTQDGKKEERTQNRIRQIQEEIRQIQEALAYDSIEV